MFSIIATEFTRRLSSKVDKYTHLEFQIENNRPSEQTEFGKPSERAVVGKPSEFVNGLLSLINKNEKASYSEVFVRFNKNWYWLVDMTEDKSLNYLFMSLDYQKQEGLYLVRDVEDMHSLDLRDGMILKITCIGSLKSITKYSKFYKVHIHLCKPYLLF